MTRTFPIRLAAALIAIGPAIAARAQASDPLAADDTQIVRLSPHQREAALEAGATRSDRDLPINGLGHGVHGEVGTEFGSNGSRALYGTAAVPLGDSGSAGFSFFTGQSGHYLPR